MIEYCLINKGVANQIDQHLRHPSHDFPLRVVMSVNQTVHEANNCKLISGTFETLVQVGLGIVGLSVLVLKRAYEKPQRPFQVWAYDASKQAIGAGVAHAANLFIAIMLVKLSKSDDAKDEVKPTPVPRSIRNLFSIMLVLLLSWIAIVLTAKLVIARFIYAFSAPLNDFGNWLFDPLSNYPKVELLFVMVACPCLMNALQFWKPAKVVGAVADEKTPLV
ncbi:hypothetical protein DYB32_007869 [Aphanomyces invadans]|uniref:Uncharacterized protein n=1 Tax=Aphanomyces invadans TaxID=157072 RepID=A0A3R6WHK2_9STRA|nr:hypothetical protein DYB32_007869 [Aphanomyces invadans]